MNEGIYQVEVCNERYVVDVRMTMINQWPDKREVLKAHFLSGPPRFPWGVKELQNAGAKFTTLRPSFKSAASN